MTESCRRSAAERQTFRSDLARRAGLRQAELDKILDASVSNLLIRDAKLLYEEDGGNKRSAQIVEQSLVIQSE